MNRINFACMANTYSRLYIQIVFAVQGRQNLISEKNREELQQFICGIVKNRNQKTLAVYCMPDHVHLLVSMNPSVSISDLVRDVKAGSSKFINDKRWVLGKFKWQEGFGSFSYSLSDVKNVIRYILNQKEHHGINTFREEYLKLLQEYEIEYDERYIFNVD